MKKERYGNMISARQACENAKAFLKRKEEKQKEQARELLKSIGEHVEALSMEGKFEYLASCKDEDVLKLVVRTLQDLGYSVRTNADGVLEIKW